MPSPRFREDHGRSQKTALPFQSFDHCIVASPISMARWKLCQRVWSRPSTRCKYGYRKWNCGLLALVNHKNHSRDKQDCTSVSSKSIATDVEENQFKQITVLWDSEPLYCIDRISGHASFTPHSVPLQLGGTAQRSSTPLVLLSLRPQ